MIDTHRRVQTLAKLPDRVINHYSNTAAKKKTGPVAGHDPNPRVESENFRDSHGAGRVRRFSKSHGSGSVPVTRPGPIREVLTRPVKSPLQTMKKLQKSGFDTLLSSRITEQRRALRKEVEKKRENQKKKRENHTLTKKTKQKNEEKERVSSIAGAKRKHKNKKIIIQVQLACWPRSCFFSSAVWLWFTRTTFSHTSRGSPCRGHEEEKKGTTTTAPTTTMTTTIARGTSNSMMINSNNNSNSSSSSSSSSGSDFFGDGHQPMTKIFTAVFSPFLCVSLLASWVYRLCRNRIVYACDCAHQRRRQQQQQKQRK